MLSRVKSELDEKISEVKKYVNYSLSQQTKETQGLSQLTATLDQNAKNLQAQVADRIKSFEKKLGSYKKKVAGLSKTVEKGQAELLTKVEQKSEVAYFEKVSNRVKQVEIHQMAFMMEMQERFEIEDEADTAHSLFKS